MNISDLSLRVLEDLNQLRPGEDPSQEVAASIERRWKTVHAHLTDEQCCYWPVDAIPAAVFDDVAQYVAVAVAPSFGALPIILQAIGEQTARGAQERIKVALRKHVAADYIHEPLQMSEV